MNDNATVGCALFSGIGAASLLLALRRCSIKRKAAEKVYECVIVGAGVSGLQSAKHLIEQYGFNPNDILILEAQNYIGGRVLQTDTFVKGFKIDLGAEIVHGSNNKLTEFAAKTGEPLVEAFCWAHGDGGPDHHHCNNGYGLYFVNSSKGKRLIRYDENDVDFRRANEMMWELAGLNQNDYPQDCSIRDHLVSNKLNPEMVDMANAGLSNTLCANDDELSLKHCIRMTSGWGESDGDRETRFKNTYACLVDYLKPGLQIRLNTPVVDIDYSEGIYDACDSNGCQGKKKPIVVTTSNGTMLMAKTVIVTAPIKALQSELINFNPPMPYYKQRALHNMEMNRAMKIILKFKQRAWPRHLQGMICSGEHCPIPEIWFREVVGAAEGEQATWIATCFTTSRYADYLITLPPKQMYQVALKQMEECFACLEPKHMSATAAGTKEFMREGKRTLEENVESPSDLPKASSVFLAGMYHDWRSQHPFIGGGYASIRVGADMNTCAMIAEPLGANNSGKIFFAGEAMNVERPGLTAHSALETAEVAARDVNHFLKSSLF